jgi:hypothetical protein
MGFQSRRSPNVGNFGTPSWEFWDKMTFGCLSHGHAQIILQWGRWWLPPSPGHGESCESMFAHGSFVHQKCPSSILTNLLFGLCMSMWVIDLLVTLPGPYLEVLAHIYTLEMLQAKEHTPTPHSSVLFTFDSHLNPLRSLGVRHMASTTLYTRILTSWDGNGKVTFHNKIKFIE